MKKLLFIPFLIFAQEHLFSQDQNAIADEFNYKIIYKLTYQPDSTRIESRKGEPMVLYIGDNISKFSSEGKVVEDSLKKNYDYSNANSASFARLRAQIPETEFDYYIHKDIPQGKISYTQEIGMDNFKYIEDKNLFDWNILPATDSIFGFPVQKATTYFAGRNYTAWFTNEIPISEGPYKFNGLPGLIIKISDDRNHYVFELTQIQKLKSPIPVVFEEDGFLQTTKEKFLEIKKEYKKDPVGYMKRTVPGVKITYGSPEQKKKVERERKVKLEKENNPIELLLP